MTSLPHVAPRVAKLTALSVGVALLATACGGSSTPTSTGSTAATAAGITCPAPSAGAGAGDPTEAFIGIYQYQDNNTYKPSKEEFGQL
jgi:branched-chain amino acid transport system substrate-binding protein